PSANRCGPHLLTGLAENVRDADPGVAQRRGLEPLGYLVSVQATKVLAVERLGDVLRQVAGAAPGMFAAPLDRSQAVLQPDPDVPATPGVPDQGSVDELADREVQMQSVVGLVPLRNPHVRKRLTTQAGSQVTEERRHVR